MKHLHYLHQNLHLEKISLNSLAEHYGTPCYLYSQSMIQDQMHAFQVPLRHRAHLICYAVKANSNIAILQLLASLGAGFDIVSMGELERVLFAGGDPKKIVYSGVVKQSHEIERALEVGIHCFNVESSAELELIRTIARAHQTRAPISLRVNPNIDAQTHPYISTGLKENKFGIDPEQALQLYRHAANCPELKIQGIACHIGSQIQSLTPFQESLDKQLSLIDRLAAEGILLQHIDLGGGLGVRYHPKETPPTISDYLNTILSPLSAYPSLTLFLEPGRVLMAESGILLTQVHNIKASYDKHFALVDAGINDLLRPALYQAYHEILAVKQHANLPPTSYDIVGPICETGDFLGKNRQLSLLPGDYLAILGVGAYGFCMSSQYNSRPRIPEILVHEARHYLIRERETIADLFSKEHLK